MTVLTATLTRCQGTQPDDIITTTIHIDKQLPLESQISSVSPLIGGGRSRWTTKCVYGLY